MYPVVFLMKLQKRHDAFSVLHRMTLPKYSDVTKLTVCKWEAGEITRQDFLIWIACYVCDPQPDLKQFEATSKKKEKQTTFTNVETMQSLGAMLTHCLQSTACHIC